MAQQVVIADGEGRNPQVGDPMCQMVARPRNAEHRRPRPLVHELDHADWLQVPTDPVFGGRAVQWWLRRMHPLASPLTEQQRPRRWAARRAIPTVASHEEAQPWQPTS